MTGSILTVIGKAKLASATPENQLEIAHVAVGDGNGSYPVLTENMATLANEVWRGTASTPIREQAPNTLMFESAIPPDVGGFTIREIAIYDRSGAMIAIGHVDPAQQKPLPTQSTGINMTVRILIELANAAETNLILQTGKMEQQAGKGLEQERPEEAGIHVSRRKLLTAFGMAGAALAAGSILRGTSTAYGKEGLSVTGTVYEGSNGKDKIPPGIAAKLELVTHNELAGRDMAEAHPASAIKDSTGKNQQEINSGLQDISEMLAISNPTNGSKVFVKHYDAAQGILEGGGEFVYDATKSNKNDGGICFNGWVRVTNNAAINVKWFGAVGDGVKDDYQALYNCFNHHFNPEVGTTDPNALQHAIPSLTFHLPRGCYRYTEPLRLPCKGTITCEGNLNYFAGPDVVTQKNRATLFYDGDNLEVAALYTPMFKYVNNSWVLISDSTEFFSYSANVNTHSMVRGCEYRFNLVTRRKTKIGLNAFGTESGKINVAIGTLGSWARPQKQASWGDYNPDDLSPKVGITCCTAWNLVFDRPRILAHNQGLYLAGSTGSVVIREGYINRQVSSAASSVTDGLVYSHSALPVSKQGLTSAITAVGADVSIYDTVTEGWGAPYMLFGGRFSMFTPHIEGPNDIMMHDWIVYNCKLDVYNWGNIRSMQLRAGTSVIYSCGMASDKGYYVHLHGSSYYGDNSLFNLLDGVPYDQYTNTAFLKISNVPTYKAINGFHISDLRNMKQVGLQGENVVKLPIYMDASRSGSKGIGLGASNAVQSLSDLVEAIRILGSNWNGVINITNNLTISASYDFSVLNNIQNIIFTINAGVTLTISNRFMVGCNNITFNGGGSIVVNSPLVEPKFATYSPVANIRLSNVTVSGASAIVRGDSMVGNVNLFVESNVNMASWTGKYLYSTSSYGFFNVAVLTANRSATVKSNEASNNNVDASNFVVANKIFVA
ncbi:phage tail protein [Paenibacillus sp. MBLB4367]|uniref:phage tail protein n=1 Tax=Paenibacillus sp. MBLB4367 TaxID=3384767 RepID=UPI0039083D74